MERTVLYSIKRKNGKITSNIKIIKLLKRRKEEENHV
jgi:hypothetical protein